MSAFKTSRLILTLAACLSLFTCTAENREPGYVYYRLSVNPTTLDPAHVVDVTGGLIAAKLFNGLVRLGDGLEVVADIARDWSVSGDGLTYTFRLRKGVRFSNGREVTAGDFKYSFERVLDPDTLSPNTWVLDKIAGAGRFMSGDAAEVKGIRVLDDHTLEIRLEEPFSPFLSLLTMTAAYVVPKEAVQEMGPDFSSSPVGTGPYVLKQWLPNRQVVLRRRDDYFQGRSRVHGIVYRVIPEDLTAVAEFELGNLDVITIPASEYSRYRASPRWSGLISSIKGIDTYYLGLNCERPPFDDPRLRRAVGLAIDRKKILATLYEGRGRLASGPVPDVLRQWPAPEMPAYDPEEARRIIKELDPPKVNFYVTADQEVVDMAEVIQSYLEAAGLRVRIRQLEWSAYLDATNKGEPDMFWLSWWADYPDPENFLFPLFDSSNIGTSGNRVRYRNPAVDALIEKGQHSTSRQRRNEYYREAEGLIVRDAPWVFFWHRTDYTLRQPWIHHYSIHPVYSQDKGLDISF
jgi:ABC-type transport system substrate-binding protein